MLFCLFFRFFVSSINTSKQLNFLAKMNIILIGYMGSGKSTVGKKLSEQLGHRYIDLDDYIQKREGHSIAQIFKNKGEIYFRKVESKYLKEVLGIHGAVISLGGGTPCYGHNMDIIKNADDAFSIYLKATISNLTDRLFKEKDSRPLISHINQKQDLSEFIGKHLFERSPFYSQSDITLETDNKTVDEIAETIITKLV